MKKIFLNVLLITISFLCMTQIVEAETYKRGIVTATSVVKKDSLGSANLLNDRNYSMTLYSPEAVEILAEEGNYYLIKYIYSGFIYTGYVPKKNVIAKEYVIDANYVQQMIAKGFPQDYAKKLAILHAIHPNWVFTPSFTGKVAGGLDFYSAVRAEAAVIDRNLTSSTNTTLRSTAPGSYANGVWKEFSGGGWFAASEQTIAFYMDPRNFMNESNFFMFENQAYNSEVQYKWMVEKSLAGTFMATSPTNPFNCGADSRGCTPGQHTYADTFIDAGAKNGVNPISLVSRVKIEQGSKGSALSLGGGWNKQYIGYYNFFNINANGATTDDVILNGLRHAYNRNWNNPYIAIIEGASLVGNSYVGLGQSTVYYQKFNTINQIYSYQYMQNIAAPYTEGYDSYVSYFRSFDTMEEWDNAAYEFLIPVYQNMPGETSLDIKSNNDASLKSLSVSECTLNPAFDSGIKSYDCYTKNTVKEVLVSAETTNLSARAEYSNKVVLNAVDTKIQIKVTSAGGKIEIYEVNVHKVAPDTLMPYEILNGIGIKVSDNYAYNFVNTNDKVSGIEQAVNGNYPLAKVTITDKNGTVKNKESKIGTGDIITVTNSGNTTSFKAVVYGDLNGDGVTDVVDLLMIGKHILKFNILENEYFVAGNVNRDHEINVVDMLLFEKHIIKEQFISQE